MYARHTFKYWHLTLRNYSCERGGVPSIRRRTRETCVLNTGTYSCQHRPLSISRTPVHPVNAAPFLHVASANSRIHQRVQSCGSHGIAVPHCQVVTNLQNVVAMRSSIAPSPSETDPAWLSLDPVLRERTSIGVLEFSPPTMNGLRGITVPQSILSAHSQKREPRNGTVLVHIHCS